MSTLRDEVLAEFRKLAESLEARWSVSDSYCELAKNSIALRTRWSIERIPGVFVSLAEENKECLKEYGLYYLIAFRGGEHQDLEKARSKSPKEQVELVKKYALDLLTGTAKDFPAFAKYVEERVAVTTPSFPSIVANKTIRPEWT